MFRLVATQTELIYPKQCKSHISVGTEVSAQVTTNSDIDDLIAKLGVRVGLETITRLHPGDSHIPEKVAQTIAAAWSSPQMNWPEHNLSRPLIYFRSERIIALDVPKVPLQFKWRGQLHQFESAYGPERISPEWWLAEREWYTGTRDYWKVVTKSGDRLWLYFAHGGLVTGGWFCHGRFA